MSQTVYTLQNGKKLDKGDFLDYLAKKIKKTQKEFGLKKESGEVYCLDDAAIGIIHGLMANKKPSIKKGAFFYCLKKEIELFGKLKGINHRFQQYKGLKLDISKMLDELEKTHKEIKYAIVNAFMQI